MIALRVRDAARALRVSPQRVHSLVRSGRLAACDDGRNAISIPLDALRAYVQRVAEELTERLSRAPCYDLPDATPAWVPRQYESESPPVADTESAGAAQGLTNAAC